jgi:hypothetical protein
LDTKISTVDHPHSLGWHGRGGCNLTAPLSISCSPISACNWATAAYHHHLICTTTPPLRTIPHCCFIWCALNRATTAQFQVLAQPPSLPRILQAHSPNTTTTLYAPPHHPYPPYPVAVLHSALEIEPRQLDFSFLAQTPTVGPRQVRFHHKIQPICRWNCSCTKWKIASWMLNFTLMILVKICPV